MYRSPNHCPALRIPYRTVASSVLHSRAARPIITACAAAKRVVSLAASVASAIAATAAIGSTVASGVGSAIAPVRSATTTPRGARLRRIARLSVVFGSRAGRLAARRSIVTLVLILGACHGAESQKCGGRNQRDPASYHRSVGKDDRFAPRFTSKLERFSRKAKDPLLQPRERRRPFNLVRYEISTRGVEDYLQILEPKY